MKGIKLFQKEPHQSDEGCFIVSLPKCANIKPLGESRVQCFIYLERSLLKKGQYELVMKEYFDLGHAESVPEEDLQKPKADILPTFACRVQIIEYNYECMSCLQCLGKEHL